MLYGRDAERRRVDDLLQSARRGRADALVLHGDAGIGKSALLRYVAGRAVATRLLQMRGVQAETAVPFAGLHALLHPVTDRVGALSPPQRRALLTALGLEIGDPPSRFLVSAALVELLGVLAEDRPVVCLVDDAQWVDPQSLAALTFAWRRLGGDRVAMLFTVRSAIRADPRPVDRLLADLPQMMVTGLDDAAADRLLAERADLDTSARQAVKEAARGNPLALSVLTPRPGSDLAATPPSLTAQLEADYLLRTRGLDDRATALVLLAAADGTGDLAVLLAAAERFGASEQDLAIAEQRGLLQINEGKVEFTHPLVRSAVYQHASSTARRQAHRALADAFGTFDAARATWHRAEAALPPAEEVARELADLAAAAMRRAASDVASRAYERAAGLTAEPRRKIGWLLDAAETAWESGQIDRAARLLSTARHGSADTDPGRLDQLRGQFEATTGSAVRGYEILVAGAESVLEVDPDRASSMLYTALRAASVAGDMERVFRVGRVAARLLDSGTRPAPVCFTAGIAELLTGPGKGAVTTLEEGLRIARGSNDPGLLYMAASAAAFSADRSASQALASRAVTLCRETGALATLAQALEPLVVAQLDVAPRQAEASADEGLRAARETGQPASAAIHLAWLASVSAVRGDRSATEDLTRQVFDLDREHGLAYPAALAVRALGLLELGLGRPADALRHLESVVTGPAHRAAQLVAMDLAMVAAVWSGRPGRAQELLDEVGSWAWMQDADADWTGPTLERWRALVADDSTSVVLYERSLERQTGSARPFLTALTQLLLGEQLRRMRRRSAARPHLRAAMETFERFDAIPWAARARTELRASGETVRRRDEEIRLTPQELQVAQLVATGASTKAVAAQLYLSPRTVDSHLRQIFTKLGISSRAELRGSDLG